jgi:replication-associated recombination protein RarA
MLHICDLTDVIGKVHAFPVKQPSGENASYQTADGRVYDNIGAREVRDRLSRSPHGDVKIVVIEHIERATTAAANALLKHLEEPLPGRYIIATSSSPDDVLPTLHSRALTIQMEPTDIRDIVSLLVREYGLSQPQAEMITHLSAGKKLRACQLAQRDDRQQLIDLFQSLQSKVKSSQLIPLIQTLKTIDHHQRPRYRDALIQTAIDDGQYGVIDALIRYEQYRSRNVHVENSLLQLAMDIAA